MKVALVLGGGGARGLAHVGVLKTLEGANIPIDMIVGCSFGAIIGGMYAQMPRANQVEQKLYEFLDTKEFAKLGLSFVKKRWAPSDDYLKEFVKNVKDWVALNLMIKRMSILKANRLQDAVNYLVTPGDIGDTKIPFACNATDLISGLPFLLTEGDIRTAICASTAIPGYFPPVEIGAKKLVDGAVSYNLPVQLARQLGATFVIAVDIHPMLHPENDYGNVLDVILRTNTITANTLSKETLHYADVVISPPVKEYFWYEFDRYVEMIKAGEEAAYHHLDEIQEKFHPKQPRRFRRLLRMIS